MTIDDDLGLSRHLVNEGRVSLLRADKFTVLFGQRGDGAYRKLCLISFNKKTGAIYAQFTYFRTDPGVVGLVTTVVGPDGNSQIDWKEGGKVSTSLVKYSHPPDGNAHFSQDGSHKTQFRAKSLDLRHDGGHLFEIHAFHLEPFETLQQRDVDKGKRLYLPFDSDGLPNGVSVTFDWRSIDYLRDRSDSTVEEIGPVAMIKRDRDGKVSKAALVAPPINNPLSDHVLLISVAPLSPPASITTPMLLFMGGWSKEAQFAPGSTATFLSFTYPIGNVDQMKGMIGLADLEGQSG